LLRGAFYPALGISVAQGLADPESSLSDCAASGVLTLMLIVAAAVLCFGASWGLSNRDHD
jgi:hypothetical protein